MEGCWPRVPSNPFCRSRSSAAAPSQVRGSSSKPPYCPRRSAVGRRLPMVDLQRTECEEQLGCWLPQNHPIRTTEVYSCLLCGFDWRAGADYVKVFPCLAMGGASSLNSLLAPFPFLKLIPTGGATLDTAACFFQEGARVLGVGSDLVNLAAVDACRPETITETAQAYLNALAGYARTRTG
jgi:hypothetical protein